LQFVATVAYGTVTELVVLFAMISIVGVFGYRAFWLFVSGDVIDETVTSIYVYSLEVRGFIVLPTLLELA